MKLALILSFLVALTAANDVTPEEKSPGTKGSLRGLVVADPISAPHVPYPGPQPTKTCVSNEVQLKAGIVSGGLVVICNNTQILLTSPIDLTNKTANVRCQSTVVGKLHCMLYSSFATRLMEGAPKYMTFDNIAFYSANATGGRGGAAYLYGGSTAFNDCHFQYNKAPHGGGLAVSNLGTMVTIRRTEFRMNEAYGLYNGKGGYGGAILVESAARVELIDSKIDYNSGYTDGGAIAVLGAKMSIVGSRIIYNSAPGPVVDEAIYARNAKIHLSDSVVAGYIAPDGTISDVTSINIDDDDEPTNGIGTYVTCSSTVNFCSGLDTVKEKATVFSFPGVLGFPTKNIDFQFFENTNCRSIAFQDSSDPKCYTE